MNEIIDIESVVLLINLHGLIKVGLTNTSRGTPL